MYFWRHKFKFQIFAAAKERPHHENLGLRPSAQPSKQRVASGHQLKGRGYHLGPVMLTRRATGDNLGPLAGYLVHRLLLD
jgi:hypothetical protein